MALQVHNVRTRKKEPFVPLDPEGKDVGLYQCGLTVYDHVHLGHACTAVRFEVIRRWLERTYRVRFVKNVTDVDDKIIKRAQELGVSPLEHAATWDQKADQVLGRLGVRGPDDAPHATAHIPGIIAFVEGILEREFAYVSDAGNVYFDVPAYDTHARKEFPDSAYGSLSRRDYRQMAAGTRKDVEADKRHPADFALWKAAKPDEPEDAQWDSPWGRGRPGWHIECSHMSLRSLDAESPDDAHYGRIDIHGGGQDLIFPHHENEIAQSQARTGQAPFVNYWMHTGFLNVEGQKMSKSLGNFIVLEELLDELDADGADPAALRYYFTQTHYRSKIDFSPAGLAEAAAVVERLERTRRLLHEVAASDRIGCADVDPGLAQATADLRSAFGSAMDDDFHTPAAIAALRAFQRAANQAMEAGPESPLGSAAAAQALEAFEECGRVLTLFDGPVAAAGGAVPDDVQALLEAREEARGAKDWAAADEMRDRIQAAGYVVQDTPQGPRLEKA